MGYTNFVNGNAPYISAQNLNNMQIELMKLVFPIGSTYITQTNTNPSTILKFGTWERVNGKVLVGLDEDDADFNEIGKTGGEKTHTLTIDEMPAHNHSARFCEGTGVYSVFPTGNGSNPEWGGSTNTIANTGEGQAHNILQPYEVVGYMWKRTA